MANSDKNILITPNTGESALPKIEVTGADNATKTLTINDDGTISFDSNISASTLTVASDLIHSGDTNNKIAFGTDTQSFQTGGTARFNISDSGLQIGSGARVTTIITQSDGIGSNDNETTLPTSAAVKDYVDNNAGGSPGGSDTFIQYNNGGSFGATTLSFDDTDGSEQFLFDDTSDTALVKIVQRGTGSAFEVHDQASDSSIFKINHVGQVSIKTATPIAGGLTINDDMYVGQIKNSAFGSASSPRYTFHSDSNTGMYSGGADVLKFSTGGTERVKLSSSGLQLGAANAEVTTILDEDDLSSDSATALATQQSIKAYVDSQSGGGASVIGGLTDVSMDITNFVDGFLLQTNSDGSAPTTGTLNNATGNIGIGKDVLKTITSADHNVAIGTQAGDSITTGGRNIMIGEFAGEAIDTATDNVIVGARAGRAIHDRTGAIMIGRGAGENAQSSGVVFIGENAGAEATADSFGYNIAIGHDAGEYGANSNASVVIGKSAGKGNSTDTSSPNQMTAVGAFAMTEITTGDDNSAFGYQAMQNITTGSDNIAIGSEALNDVTTGSRNIAIGYRAADGFDTENDNIAIGTAALGGSVAGAEYNVVIGNYAGDAITSADNSVIIGHNAGTAVTTGGENVMIGYQSGYGITDGGSNIFIGQSTGFSGGSNEQGNVAVGHLALSSIANADYNVGVGYRAGRYVKGQHNVYVGYDSGNDSSNTGSKNIGVGYQAGNNITSGSNNVVIGAADVSSATGDSQLSISSGDGGVTWITGTSAGHVSLGNFAFNADQTVGSGQDNHVLTYDNSAGTISLEAASGGSPAGSDGQIQYNNGGSFGGDAEFVWDDTNERLVIGSVTSQHDGLQKLTVKGTDAGFLLEKHDDSASGGPSIQLYRYSASEADGDLMGQIVFRGEGSTGNPSTYMMLRTEILDTTEGTKDGSLIIRGLQGNSQTDFMQVGQKVQIGPESINPSGVTAGKLTVSRNDTDDSFAPTLLLVDGDADANNGPMVKMYRNTSSPADNDELGSIFFAGEDSAGNERTYASIRAISTDVTSATNDGELKFQIMSGGLQTTSVELTGSGLTLSKGTFNGDMGTSSYKPAVFMDSGNVNVTTTETTIPFDTEVLDPAGNASIDTSLGGDGKIRLVAGGYYRISYSIPINDDGSTGPDRTRVFVDMQTSSSNAFSSPTTVAQSRCQVYTRESSGGSGLSTSFIYEHTANDYIRLRVDAQNSTDISTETNQSQISIEYLGPA